MDSSQSKKENESKDQEDSKEKTDPKKEGQDAKETRPESRAKSRTERPSSKAERPASKGGKKEAAKDDGGKEERPSSRASRADSKAEKRPESKAAAKTEDGENEKDERAKSRSSSARSRPVTATDQEKAKSPEQRPQSVSQNNQDSPREDVTVTAPPSQQDTPDMTLNLPKEDETKPASTTPRQSVRSVYCEICPQSEESKMPKAEFVCTSCVERYCVRCAKRHVETLVFAKHEVIPMEPTVEDEIRGLEDFPCLVHKTRNLGYFCHGCQKAVCGTCISFDHGGQQHILDPISRLDSNKRILLTRYEKAVNRDVQKDMKSETPDLGSRPVPQLYWMRESDSNKADYIDEPNQLCGSADVAFLPDGQVVVVNRWKNSVVRFDADGGKSEVVLTHVGACRLCATADDRVAVVDESKGGQIRIIGLDPISKDARATYSKAIEVQKQTQERDKERDKERETRRDMTMDLEQEITDVDAKDKENDSPNQGRESAMSKKNEKNSVKRGKEAEDGINDEHEHDHDKFDTVTLSGKREDTLSEKFVQNWKPLGVKRPLAIAVNRFNQWIISDYEQFSRATVSIYEPDAIAVSDKPCYKCFGGQGEREDQFDMPSYITCDSKGRIIISDFWNHAVKIFDSRGNYLKKIGKGWGKKDGCLTNPKGVCVDDEDNIIVVDSGNNRVSEFSSNGAFIRNILTAQDGVHEPEGIAFLKIVNKERGDESKEGSKSPNGSTGSQTVRSKVSDSKPVREEDTIRRLALTMCVGRQYAGLFLYNLIKQ